MTSRARMILQKERDGRIYYAHLPDLLRGRFRTTADSVSQTFSDFDKMLIGREVDLGEADFANYAHSVFAPVFASVQLGLSNPVRESEATTVLAAESLASSVKISLRAIIRGNSIVLGVPRSELRRGPNWVGSDHPSDAWYVAAPAASLPKLMDDLVAFVNDSQFPTTLRACVGLRQLLQIHPFDDGNGRTARALFLGLLFREVGRKASALSVLARLWEFRGMRLHHSSLHLRDTGDWTVFLSLCESILASVMEKGADSAC